MKKYLSVLAVAAMAAYATSAFAQGTVVLANSTGLVSQWTSSENSTLISVPKNGGFVQLFWAAAGTAGGSWDLQKSQAANLAANPGWSLDPKLAGFTTPAAGKFSGGTLTLSPLTPGGAIDYMLVAWTGTASSFDAAIAGGAMAGVSSKFNSTTANPTTTPAGIPVSLGGSFTGMTLSPVNPIPEPSTFALAGLGAAALLIFR